MAIAYSAVTQLGLFSQQYPPPLLPKPGKDNIRLQKLLKRTAKKKSSAQVSQSAATFRSSLSPVDEASPDQEHSDHFSSPRTPEITPSLYGIQHPPRFTVRPLYQHVASPYPHHARIFPQMVTTPSQNAPTVSSYSALIQVSGVLTSTEQVAQPTTAGTPQPYSSVPEVTIIVTEFNKPEFSTFPKSHTGLRSATTVATQPSKSKVPGPIPYSMPAGQNVLRPLTVLTPLIKSKSPRPTFKATEHSKSPKPMFDVPQIRMYTASTSYYETSRTPPVHGTAGLTSIGSTVPESTTLAETNRDWAPASEIQRGKTQIHPPSLDIDLGRITPISEIKRATPTPEIKGKSPTPVTQAAQATTSAFEILRHDYSLSAVSPVTIHPEKSSSLQTVPTTSSSSASQYVKTTALSETLLNGDSHSDIKPAAKLVEQCIKKSKSEPDLKRETSLASAGAQRAETPTLVPSTQAVGGYQRPKTPTYEAFRLMTRSPGYKKPKTPPYGVSASGASKVAIQRPKTPVSQLSKTSQEPTPAEHAVLAATGISVSAISTNNEVKANRELTGESAQEPRVTQQPSTKTFKEKDSFKNKTEPHQGYETLAATASIPIAAFSQPSTLKREAATFTGLVATKRDTATIQEIPKNPTSVSRFSEKHNMETLNQEVRPITETLDSKSPSIQGGDQGPLKTIKLLLARDKDEKRAVIETKADVSVDKKVETPASDAKIKPKGFESDATAPALAVNSPAAESNEDKEKQRKTETTSATEKKVSDEVLPAAKSLLKRPKDLKSKMTGWSRLKKHMVVEQEEPKFPEIGSQKEASGQDQSEVRLENEPGEKSGAQNEKETESAPKATKMWDAVLFQMFSSKENIMHQIELSKSEEERKEDKKSESTEIPSFAYRLPVLLFSPKFDAKKLKEAASRPVTKISTVFEMGLIGRKGVDEEPKDFNRTARGFTTT